MAVAHKQLKRMASMSAAHSAAGDSMAAHGCFLQRDNDTMLLSQFVWFPGLVSN